MVGLYPLWLATTVSTAQCDDFKGQCNAPALPVCADTHENCVQWAADGECNNNPAYMLDNCGLSCALHTGDTSNCDPDSVAKAASSLKMHKKAEARIKRFKYPKGLGEDELASAAAGTEMAFASESGMCTGNADAAALISPSAVKGMHIICRIASRRFAVWTDATGTPSLVVIPSTAGKNPTRSLKGVVLARARALARPKNWHEPELYTATGNIAVNVDDHGLSVLIEGGQWVWPPGSIGSIRTASLPEGKSASIKTLSILPLVFEVENFLEERETNHIIDAAAPHLFKSGVQLKDADVGECSLICLECSYLCALFYRECVSICSLIVQAFIYSDAKEVKECKLYILCVHPQSTIRSGNTYECIFLFHRQGSKTVANLFNLFSPY